MGKISKILKRYGKDKTRLMDILLDIQSGERYISPEAIGTISKKLGISLADVRQTVSFYHFFTEEPSGDYTVYLNDSITSKMAGYDKVKEAFEKEAGTSFGSVTKDGKIGLYNTPCIGMNDQEPSAIINGIVFTKLDAGMAGKIVSGMRSGKDAAVIAKELGGGDSGNSMIPGMVSSNIRQKGTVLFTPHANGESLRKAVAMTQDAIMEEIKESGLRGRGGAGFPAYTKWDFCRQNASEKKYVICNADEGEPGTFKDRVLLTEMPGLLFEGMAIAGYAIGAEEGILYLRNEYVYLKPYLEHILDGYRKDGLLGKNAAGKKGFNFDIRIQMGAGAYVCGEETALIESAEGKRGEPRIRPPFPVEVGYMGQPTSVNNVETFCNAAKIIDKGTKWFKQNGTKQSLGTKVLSVSGDCKNPGIYEVQWGITVDELLKMTGGEGAKAVQVGGPSGTCVPAGEFSRKICFEDLATGGSVIIFGKDRDIFEVVSGFVDFFIGESCGSCAPCRVGNVLLKEILGKIVSGKGTEKDIAELENLGKVMKSMNRCGLGQTAANPVITTIKNFRGEYDSKINKGADYVSEFDMAMAVKDSCEAAGRKPKLEV